jgi:hypothetical protein
MIGTSSTSTSKTSKAKHKSQKTILDWNTIGLVEAEIFPTKILTFKRQFNTPIELASNIISEANKLRITVVCNNLYPEGLFKPVYFTAIEKSLGHTRDIKTFELTRTIDYCFTIVDCKDGIEVWLNKKSIEPQILSDPTSFLTRLNNL